jgi:hypothetical protein
MLESMAGWWELGLKMSCRAATPVYIWQRHMDAGALGFADTSSRATGSSAVKNGIHNIVRIYDRRMRGTRKVGASALSVVPVDWASHLNTVWP